MHLCIYAHVSTCVRPGSSGVCALPLVQRSLTARRATYTLRCIVSVAGNARLVLVSYADAAERRKWRKRAQRQDKSEGKWRPMGGARTTGAPPSILQRSGEAMTSTLLVGAVVGALGLVSFLAWLLRAQRRRQNLPPERSGWLPWLGCAVAFGKAPLFFIQKTRKEVGSLIGSHGKLCSMPAAQGSDCIHLLHWTTYM